MENTNTPTATREAPELTHAQQAVLDELAGTYDAVRVTRCLADDYVIMRPYAPCPNCQPCTACDDLGLVPEAASARVVSPDGIVSDLGHVA